VYKLLGLLLSSMVLGSNDKILVLLNPEIIFFLRMLSLVLCPPILPKVIFLVQCNSCWSLLCLTFLKAISKSLKHVKSKGCNAWDVCEGKVTISSPNVYACSIASRVTCNPWPSKMSRCLFIREIPPSIVLLKKEKNYLNKHAINHPCFWLHTHTSP
jgi:hypothetical protein